MNNKKGFTLIELLAVLVVLAILAVITVPIVTGIINKTRQESYKRSIENYGKKIEDAVAEYQMDHPDEEIPTNINTYKNLGMLDLKGTKVDCGSKFDIDNNKVKFYRKCTVGDIQTDYTYSNGKIIILDKELYDAYFVGDCESKGTYVNYKNSKYCVMEDSSEEQTYITLLKYEPLTVEEVESIKYDSNGVNRVNRKISAVSSGEIYNCNGYAGVTYYSSDDCNGDDQSGCIYDYKKSDIKYIVDNWEKENFKNNELQLINGYTTRLITYEDLEKNLGYSNYQCSSKENVPVWVYTSLNSDKWPWWYWTMTKEEGSSQYMFTIADNCTIGKYNTVFSAVYNNGFYSGNYPPLIRPVINLKKDALN